jgi:putative ABC transport system permease protein
MNELWKDLRYAARMLRKKPGFALVAVVTLALGIGANTAIFTVVNTILLRPLPYRDPERIVQIQGTYQRSDVETGGVSPSNFLDLRGQAKNFEELNAASLWGFSLTGTDETTEIFGAKVTANFFSALGVAPLLGRLFLPEEDHPDRGRVAVISHGLWQRRFGGDPTAIGKTMKLDDDPYTVIGVLRPDFRQSELTPEYNSEVWTPLVIDPAANNRGANFLQVYGKLKPGVSLAQAQNELTVIARQLEMSFPKTNAGRGFQVLPLGELSRRGVNRILFLLLCATGFVLLIACANVANLMLARVVAREKEFAVRLALGAGRGRLVRLLLAESLVLALIGGVCGLLIAAWGTDLLVSIAPEGIPRLDEISPDGRVIGFAFGLSLFTMGMLGGIPAWQASRVNLDAALKEGGRGSTTGQRLRGVLVVAEIALTVVLLIGAGLLTRSLIRLQNVKLGFNPDKLLTMRVSLLDSKYKEGRAIADFYRQAIARIESLPGVRGAAVISAPPLVRTNNLWVNIDVEGRTPEPGRALTAYYRLISPDFFRVMEIPLVRGRAFTDLDSREGLPVTIINEGLARRYFPDSDPIGKKIVVARTAREIVGVAANIRHRSLTFEEELEMYVPQAQNPRGTTRLAIRASADPGAVAIAAQKAIWQGDPDAAVSIVTTMDQTLAETIARPRFNALLLSLFSVVALLLASVGVYGVMSYLVTQSTREIGVRMALGARGADILRLVVGKGVALALTGISVGLAAAAVLTRFAAKLLFEVSATDPYTFGGTAALLTVVAIIACWLPARRAMKVDPMIALRYE